MVSKSIAIIFVLLLYYKNSVHIRFLIQERIFQIIAVFKPDFSFLKLSCPIINSVKVSQDLEHQSRVRILSIFVPPAFPEAGPWVKITISPLSANPSSFVFSMVSFSQLSIVSFTITG